MGKIKKHYIYWATCGDLALGRWGSSREMAQALGLHPQTCERLAVERKVGCYGRYKHLRVRRRRVSNQAWREVSKPLEKGRSQEFKVYREGVYLGTWYSITALAKELGLDYRTCWRIARAHIRPLTGRHVGVTITSAVRDKDAYEGEESRDVRLSTRNHKEPSHGPRLTSLPGGRAEG